VADRTEVAAVSMKVSAPGSRQVNVTTVVERKVPSPGLPWPSVRSNVMSYPVTSSRRARSAASTWVRLRTPATFTLLSLTLRSRGAESAAAGVRGGGPDSRVFHATLCAQRRGARHPGGRTSVEDDQTYD